MYAVATMRIAVALGLPFLAPVASAFFMVALAAWTLVFMGLAWQLLRRLVRPGV
jgi:hypothetical protein